MCWWRPSRRRAIRSCRSNNVSGGIGVRFASDRRWLHQFAQRSDPRDLGIFVGARSIEEDRNESRALRAHDVVTIRVADVSSLVWFDSQAVHRQTKDRLVGFTETD